jgi:hypothetical protein
MKMLVLFTVILLFTGSLFAESLDDIRKKLDMKKEDNNKNIETERGKGFSQIVGKYYIVQVKDILQKEAEEISKYMDKMMEEFLKLYEYPFGTRTCYITVYGLEKDYRRVAKIEKMDNARAFSYSKGINECVITYSGPDIYPVLSHESFHVLVENIFKNNVPFWFNEGMSSYYEMCSFDGDVFESNKINKKRLIAAKGALQAGQWPKIRDLARMSYDEFYHGDTSVNYAVSWSLVYYLKNVNEKAYKNFINDLALGKSFNTCIRQNYSMDQDELEENLAKYIENL